jgi:hypothetical protein
MSNALEFLCYADPHNLLKSLVLVFFQALPQCMLCINGLRASCCLIVYSLCKKHCNGVQARSEMKVWNKAQDQGKINK